MKILVAEDDAATRAILARQLGRLGHEPLLAEDGEQAWKVFRAEPVEVVVTDWMMPGLSGLALCRRIRKAPDRSWAYVLLLTGKTERRDLLAGLEAGADEFMSKPYDLEVLRARLHVASRVLDLESSLRRRVVELETALAEVKTLRGLLPICSYCKKVRDADDAWQAIEAYVSSHADVAFSHGVCPTCYVTVVALEVAEVARERRKATQGAQPAQAAPTRGREPRKAVSPARAPRKRSS